jgi:hypothetical protein
MKIVTAVVNNPEFIILQYYSLYKYCKTPYEFIVFNDAKSFPDFTNYTDTTIKSKIEQTCKNLNIKCINIPNDHHQYDNTDAAHRCHDSMNFILNYQLENPDQYLCIDSDMFLIDDFDISRYENYDCAIVLQSRNNNKTNYFWNGLYYFDITKMQNKDKLKWDCCQDSDGYDLDVGGMMQEWLILQMGDTAFPTTEELRYSTKQYHTNQIYFIKHLCSNTWNFNEMPERIKNKEIPSTPNTKEILKPNSQF